jgi:hypothetical protein
MEHKVAQMKHKWSTYGHKGNSKWSTKVRQRKGARLG